MGFFLKRCVALMLVFTVMPGGEMASAATAGVEMTADQKQNQNESCPKKPQFLAYDRKNHIILGLRYVSLLLKTLAKPPAKESA